MVCVGGMYKNSETSSKVSMISWLVHRLSFFVGNIEKKSTDIMLFLAREEC